MKKFKTMATFLGGALIGGILLGSLSIATAEDVSSKTNTISPTASVKAMGDLIGIAKMRGPGGFKGHGKMMLSVESFDKLVADKVITQKKADEIKTFIDEQEKAREELKEKMQNLSKEERQKLITESKEEFKGKGHLFDQLVENKILTEQQAETIQTKLREEAQAQRKQNLTEAVQNLVENKTLTKAQSEKITKQFDDAMKERDALFEKTKGMTPEERHQFMMDNKANFTNPIDTLVKNGTITEDQAVKLKEALPHKGFKGNKGKFKGPRGMFKGLTDSNEQVQSQ